MENPDFNVGQQFSSIISSNYAKCPGCNRNYVDGSSPVSMVDNKTRICNDCSVGEVSRDVLKGIDPSSMLKTGSSLEELNGSLYPAIRAEDAKKRAEWDSHVHEKRIRNADVPIPAPTKSGKWEITYGKNRGTGELEAYASHPNSMLAHDAILDHETGEVSFGLRGTAVPPETVKNHITTKLQKHYAKYVLGKHGLA